MVSVTKQSAQRRAMSSILHLAGSLVFAILALGALGSLAHGEVGDWTTYTNANSIQDLQVLGDDLWCVTLGGVLQVNTVDGTINKYTNVDGLGYVVALSLSVDRLGKLWFGTDGGGVSTYEPFSNRWKTYTEFDGIAGKMAGAILASGDRVWVGTDRGISLFVWNEGEGDYFWKENYLSERRVPVEEVRAFFDYGNEIWVGMVGGVARARYRHPDFIPNLQDSASWTNYDESDGLTHSQVNCLALIDSSIWAGTENGVSTFQESTWVSRSSGMPSYTVVYDLLQSGNQVWAATSNGLYLYDTMSSPIWDWLSVLAGEVFTALALDEAGTLWVGTEKEGVLRQDGEERIRYLTEAPAQNNIERVVLDHREQVWITTIAPGYIAKACRLADDHWTVYDESDGLQTGQGLPALFVDFQGRKWFGSWGDGVGLLDDEGTSAEQDDTWLHFDEENSGLQGIIQNPQYVVVTDIAQDLQGNYWFLNYLGVESGLAVCDPTLSEWATYSVRDGLVFPEVVSLAIDQAGIKWVGAQQEGLSRFDDAGTPFDKLDDDPIFGWQTYSESNSDPYRVIVSDNVTAICVDGEGVVWIGTAGGLMRFNGRYFSTVEGLLDESVNVIAADARDNIWVGTNSGVSVLRADGDIWAEHTTSNSGLVSDKVQDIAVNLRTGEIWVATDLGLSRYESGIIRPVTSMESISVYPNPFFPETGEGVVIFEGLADGSTVHIYNVSGELLREILMSPNNLNRASWDGRNDHGAPVASGIYYFLASNQAGLKKAGKIALVR